ncbi:MAG: GreA/GreB family elongation factor [Patescibacteria group bacterium]
MKSKRIEFTNEGYIEIQQQLRVWEKKRENAVEELATARAMGDLSENAAYTAARRKLSGIDYQIRRHKMLVKNGVVVEKPIDAVGLGSLVTINDGTGEKTYTIVGTAESDLASGRLSQFSPIGRSLMGKKAGETVRVRIPAGERSITIITIA